ncbi:MAG TPA: hypothetical protein P5028_01440 [Candidatus Marinimicrobia bacterium]|nr:hypothetical protein [Candidatus Neomarinimicrobiota bacterium]HRS90695.1 hypothetical protein [Candidatus Neomarinimicrobiota bacterium]HRU93402.1 hypothetical protein [Candidatus Neomarinimicrobiota bacterium]
MKLKFRHRQFLVEAAKAVYDVFSGQPFHTLTYMIDPGLEPAGLYDERNFTGFINAPIAVSDDKVLENIRSIQHPWQIKLSDKLEGHYNLTLDI